MAKQKYKQRVKQERMQISALRREARTHYNAQRFQQALDVYAHVIFLVPQDATSHKGKADAFYALERYEEACMSYEQSILLEKSYTLAHKGLGNALYALKKYKEARLAYEQVLRLDTLKRLRPCINRREYEASPTTPTKNTRQNYMKNRSASINR